MEQFKGRTVEFGDRVKVYYDLHGNTFSIQKGQRVHAKSDAVVIENATFEVNENGRKKVLEEGKKNVHAKVNGLISSVDPDEDGVFEQGIVREATYNPFKYSSFVDKETEEPIEQADVVILQDKRIFFMSIA
ncbi:hypothetical protein CHL76_02370 [Marinococcus halophilus]|uniref:Uncharacterized protein n=1 Tax=Marinococcus halophilus TaxID=1371 RepID=A0A510Y3J9_MARHA|nr:hypothetical protein [Marinococcus halophilus]OZT81220.1 hypothetical protein CHL76_02370 [Marinococcus halophilus]GEK57157.1 hypothetical protein MHA01_00620 [Marinococcus halophilus]